ncbi:MAG: LuxR C-terminal-related transcriptional regulator [Bryobacteraceae bacterium]
MPTILLVDAQDVYRRGIKQLIENGIADARVIETSALRHSDLEEKVDLVLIDFGSLDHNSSRILNDANDRNPEIHHAIISTSRNRSDVLNCLSAGFRGYVHKHQSDEEWISAISDLLSGRIYVPPWLAHHQEAEVSFESSPPADTELETLKLTRRQTEVLPLLAKGMSNKEIARELNIAEGTTKVHTTALLRALGARNRTEAAFFAAKLVGAKGRLGKAVGGRFVSLTGRAEVPLVERKKIR